MEVVKVNRDNLASVLMGKNIQFPWRGQRDVVISVPYNEWIKFIQEYGGYLQYRQPIDYKKALSLKGEDVSIRYFMYDVSWALYSELACSSNVQRDATLILPYFDNGRDISIDEAMSILNEMDMATVTKYHSYLKAITRTYYNLMGIDDLRFGLVDLPNLSDWNKFIFKMCLFLQSRSSNTIQTERLNVDWRNL